VFKQKITNILNLKWEIEFFKKLSVIIEKFSISEKVIFFSLCTLFIISGINILNQANKSFIIQVPTNGGTLKEGIIGSPRFVNPVLAISDVDHDLTSLVYSGLMKTTPDNSIITDMAESYEISKDGLEYTFTLKDNIYFQDGVKLTTDDILFTIEKIQDSTIKSPKRPNFYDVKVEKINEKQIVFTLKKPYFPFLQNLTIGILPKHLWGDLNADQFSLSQYNVEPIGSGPYKINKMQTLQKKMLLIPTYYELIPFNKYILGKPFIDKLIINFYSDEKALIDGYNKGDIETLNSITPEKIAELKLQNNSTVKTTPLPRVFAVFFNENQSEVIANKEVRQALNIAIDRQKIVDKVLSGYGDPLYGPIPKGLIDTDSTNEQKFDLDKASSTLSKGGWIKNTGTGIWEKKIDKKKTIQLEISISTLNSPNLVKTAELIKEDWEKLGAKVDIKQFEFGDLQQNIIRPRKFEALLYGEVVGRDMDLFAFWHSSQRNDPGLNISMYANSKVDSILESARKTMDPEKRISDYISFETEIQKDIPAIFLYSPEFIYIVPNKVYGSSIQTIDMPFERFLNINNWYIETNNLWKIFQ
jgi:peptide/nickel transport system substrate-binding protein